MKKLLGKREQEVLIYVGDTDPIIQAAVEGILQRSWASLTFQEKVSGCK